MSLRRLEGLTRNGVFGQLPPSGLGLVTHIEDYRIGLVPLVVQLTLIGHYVRILNVPYLKHQVYLNPHPKELALRNHV